MSNVAKVFPVVNDASSSSSFFVGTGASGLVNATSRIRAPLLHGLSAPPLLWQSSHQNICCSSSLDIDAVGLLADEYYRTLHGAPRRGDNGGPGDADGAACVRRERVRRTHTILGMDLDRTSPAALTAAIRRTCAAR